MAKKYRNRAQENSRTIRINLGDYALFRQAAAESGVSIREVIHSWLAAGKKPSPAQIPMSIFRVMPVASVVAVNGSKSTALGIKPKGGVIHG